MKNRNALLLLLAATFLMGCSNQNSSSGSEPLDPSSEPTASSSEEGSSSATPTSSDSEPTSSDPSTSEGSSSAPVAEYEVNVHALTTGFVNAKIKGEETSFAPGESVTLTLSVGSNMSEFAHDASFDHFEHIYVHAGEIVAKPTWKENEDACTSTEVSFTMGEGDQDVYVVYSVQQHLKEGGYGCSLSSDSTSGIKLLGISPSETYDYIDAYVYGGAGFVATSFEYKIGEGEWAALEDSHNQTYIGTTYESLGSGLYNVTVRPNYQEIAGPVTIRAIGEYKEVYSITYSGLDEDYINVPDSSLPSSALEGEYVTVTVYAKEGAYIKEIKVTGLPEENDLYISGGWAYFTMPANNVAIEVVYAMELKINYVASDHIESVQFSRDSWGSTIYTTIAPGEGFYVLATASKGYQVTKAILNGTTEFAVSWGSLYVSVPADATEVNIALVAEQAYAVTTTVTNGECYTSDASYVPGSEVSLSIYPNDDYVLDSITFTDGEGKTVNLAYTYEYYSLTFTMPAHALNVAVSFKQAENLFTITFIYDENAFEVEDNNWNALTTTTTTGNLYFSVSSYNELSSFWMSFDNGTEVTYQEVTGDPEMGEPASYSKTTTFTADTTVRIGETKESVTPAPSTTCTITFSFDEDQYIVKDYNFNSYANGGTASVENGSTFGLSVQDQYGEKFYVGITGTTTQVIAATEDPDTGEYTFSHSFTVTENLTIKIGATEASVQ